MSQIKFVEKIKTHILYSTRFFESRAVCEIMWKYVVEPEDTNDSTAACWVIKSNRTKGPTRVHTHTHTHADEYVMLLFDSNNGFVHAP